MKIVMGILSLLALAVIAWGGWFLYDLHKSTLTVGAGEAIAATPEAMNTPEIKAKLKNRVLGDPNAPIEVYMFSSFTCYHCAHFHKEVLPKLKAKYADKGIASFYFSDFPLDTRAAAATLISRCMPEDKYWQFLDAAFEGQGGWALALDYKETLKSYAALGGLDKATADNCLNDKAFLKAILLKRDKDSKTYDIKGTPTIMVGKRGETPTAVSNNFAGVSAEIEELTAPAAPSPKKK